MTSNSGFLRAVRHDEKTCGRNTCVWFGVTFACNEKSMGDENGFAVSGTAAANAMERRLYDKGKLWSLPWKLFVA